MVSRVSGPPLSAGGTLVNRIDGAMSACLARQPISRRHVATRTNGSFMCVYRIPNAGGRGTSGRGRRRAARQDPIEALRYE
jgi:hypothetical protein